MATKTSIRFSEVPETEPHPYRDFDTDIVLTIEGLIAKDNGTFVLRGVEPLQMDFPKVVEVLTEAKIDAHDAEILVDEFFGRVFQHQLAKIIAQRTKRVG